MGRSVGCVEDDAAVLFSLRGEETADGPMPTGTRRIVLWCIALCITRCSSVARAHAANYSHRAGCNGTTVISPASARLYHELSGAYSHRLYGARDALPPCSELRLVWLPLMDDATLRRLYVCYEWSPDRQSLPRHAPVVMLPHGYMYRDAALLPHALPGFDAPAGLPLAPRVLASGSWVEVTHCAVGEPFPYFYRMPGSGLSLFTGRVAAYDKPAERALRERARWAPELIARGFDTAHFYESLGPSTEIVMLRAADATYSAAEMAVAKGWLRCGQPPNVRACRADEPAVALAGYTCPSDFGTKALHERLRDARVVSRLSEPHLCLNGNNSQISFNHTLT